MGVGWGSSGTVSGESSPLSKCDIRLKGCQQIKVPHTHDSVVDFSFFLSFFAAEPAQEGRLL